MTQKNKTKQNKTKSQGKVLSLLTVKKSFSRRKWEAGSLGYVLARLNGHSFLYWLVVVFYPYVFQMIFLKFFLM